MGWFSLASLPVGQGGSTDPHLGKREREKKKGKGRERGLKTKQQQLTEEES